MEDRQEPSPRPDDISASPMPIQIDPISTTAPILHPMQQGLPQNVIGQCVVYSASKDLAGVPLPGPAGTFARVSRRKLPTDTLQRLGTDYVSAFVDIFGSVASGYKQAPAGFSKSSILAVSKKAVSTMLGLSGNLMVPSSDVNGTQLPEHQRPGKSRKYRDADKSPGRGSHSPSSSLPVRQSERRIRTQLLQNAVLDDDLGIGIDDDFDQRRSWHQPRVHPKQIKEHRISGYRLLFLVQQPAGNSEWLDESLVDQDLQKKYKIDVLGMDSGEEIARPLRGHRRRSKKTENSPDHGVPISLLPSFSDQASITRTTWKGTP